MSLIWLGTTTLTVGSLVKSVGKFVMGKLAVSGSPLVTLSCQFTQGLCLRTYSLTWQTREPTEGRSSEYPANVSPAASNACPRLGVVKVCGHELSVVPCVDPENSAR